MQEDRRRFLKSLGMAALAPLITASPAGASSAATLPAAAVPGPGLAVTALGGAFLVNGWVLSKADLTALGLHAD